ncbi:competence type IV pilus ATPase ComGA [Holzapfeliella floricola]|uniref:ComG operon protein 1 n=1 Tax=Holzapfeliella floricola DSM 23037 = JCM 16512 TaxID=1423744 RepID=A0A0R2DU10_9LACO|nr:competence type IV pilus ATPase ComGA [Holzapfeliella floricola]KRN03524.1 ComG operon protein 1 [Holzapfeliella floricola DSM 23037 = JCM 16512]
MTLSIESLNLVKEAVKHKAQDLYLLPSKSYYRICYKYNNEFKFLRKMPKNDAQLIINQLKYVAKLDIAEHRRPQNGSFNLDDYPDTGFRIATLSDYESQESMVVRIIYSENTQRYFFPEQLNQLKNLATKRGLIVFSGPVGSGKTTTMYEIAKSLIPEKMVMTIEDPVEIKNSDFFQVQVNEQVQMSYEDLLKAALRHRPDVLIVGEIRDSKTAQVAIEAALSGHLVLATIHAKSTYGIIERFKQLGVETSQLQNTLNCICYQRLLPNIKYQLACLIDILVPQKKYDYQKSQYQNYYLWQNHLQNIYDLGYIDEKTFITYQEG